MTEKNRASFGLRNIFFKTVLNVVFSKFVSYISIDYDKFSVNISIQFCIIVCLPFILSIPLTILNKYLELSDNTG